MLPDFPYAELRAADRPARRPRRPARGRRPRLGRGAGRRPPGAARGRSPTPRSRRCRRTSASSRPRAWPRRCVAGDPDAARDHQASRSRASWRSSSHDERRDPGCCATSAAAARSGCCPRATAGERAAARASRSTSTTTAARSATSGCGRRSPSRPRWRRPAWPASCPSGRRGPCCPRVVGGLLRSTASPACYFHLRGAARKPGGLAEATYNLVMGPPALAPGALTMIGGHGARGRRCRGGSAEVARSFREPTTCPTPGAAPRRPAGCRASGAGRRRRCTAATRTTTCSPTPSTGTR